MLFRSHNGTISEFDSIRRVLLNTLDDMHFSEIKGHTDSEHLFMLISYLLQKNKSTDLSCLCEATIAAIEHIHDLKKQCLCVSRTSINSVLTNGKELVGIRYLANSDKHYVSLYYKYVDAEKTGVIVASEKLDNSPNWQTVPMNHMIKINQELAVEIIPLENLSSC